MLENTTQFISLSLTEIISISLGSAVIATLLGKLFDFLIEKWKDNKERQGKLYKPVKFYLMLLDHIDLNQDILVEEMEKSSDEIKFENKHVKDNWQIETNQQMADIVRPILDESLDHIEKIKKLFESNPSLIEDRHWEVIMNFFDGYHKRKMLTAGGWPKKHIHLPTDAYVNWSNAVFEAIKELRRKILE